MTRRPFHSSVLPSFIALVGCLVICCGSLFAQDAIAKWTDITGKKTIEAEFVKLDGDKVVLKRAGGSTVTVPLSKLSLASQLQAKRLANPEKFQDKDAGKTEDKFSTTKEEMEKKSASEPSKSVEPRKLTLPSGLSVKDTIDAVAKEVEKGNIGVLAELLNPEEATQSGEAMKRLASKVQASTFDSIRGMFLRIVDALRKKKEFIINYPKIEEEYRPAIKAHYDTIVDAIEALDKRKVIDLETWQNGDSIDVASRVFTMVHEFGARWNQEEKAIGGKGEFDLPCYLWAPIGTKDLLAKNIKIKEESKDQATVVVPGYGGSPEKTVQLQRVNGYWYSKSDPNSQEAQQAKQMLESIDKIQPDQIAGNAALVLGLLGGFVDKFEEVDSQKKFNQTIDELVGLAKQFGGGLQLPVPQ